jgi:hypothetical protein
MAIQGETAVANGVHRDRKNALLTSPMGTLKPRVIVFIHQTNGCTAHCVLVMVFVSAA